jgi:hypothetical protein
MGFRWSGYNPPCPTKQPSPCQQFPPMRAPRSRVVSRPRCLVPCPVSTVSRRRRSPPATMCPEESHQPENLHLPPRSRTRSRHRTGDDRALDAAGEIPEAGAEFGSFRLSALEEPRGTLNDGQPTKLFIGCGHRSVRIRVSARARTEPPSTAEREIILRSKTKRCSCRRSYQPSPSSHQGHGQCVPDEVPEPTASRSFIAGWPTLHRNCTLANFCVLRLDVSACRPYILTASNKLGT